MPPADRSDLKVRLFLGTERYSTENVEGMNTLSENLNPGLEFIPKVYDFFNGVPVIRLFLRIGLYTWLMIAALVYGLGTPGKRRAVLLLIPEVLLWIGCCFSPENGHFRYAFPFIVSGTLVSLAVFFGCGGSAPDPVKQ